MTDSISTVERARRYLSKCPSAVSGQRGHDQTFAVACVLVNGFDLPESDVAVLLSEYNSRCVPPWSDSELLHKLRSAQSASHNKPRGHLLGESGYVAKTFLEYIPAQVQPAAKASSKKYNPQARTSLPEPLDDSCRRFLLAAFDESDSIAICDASLNAEGRSIPLGSGITKTRAQWIDQLDKHDGDPNKLFTKQQAGAFVRINPMMPGGSKDKDVSQFKHALIEFDKLSIEEQFSIISQSNAPCSAILGSGGKSVHAWIKVDAKDAEEYASRVAWIYDHFKQYGVDPKNKNPSRFSRLPGMNRGDKKQLLYALNTGAESWLAWQTQKEQETLGEVIQWKDIFSFDSKNDPSTVLGHRWLCRGGSCVIVGQSGIGKSSLMAQASSHWAIGDSFFGVTPKDKKPLKSLIIQAENDLGDISEMFSGVISGMEQNLSEDMLNKATTLLPKNIVPFRNQTHTGMEFCSTLRRLIEIHHPDIVWVDPLLAFFGDDISNQKACSQFLRNWINPILEATGVVLILMHHTNKPDKDSKSKSGWTRNDYSYAGSGSSELTNWARAIVVLKQIDDDNYKLSFTKRGGRAGAKALSGDFTRDIYLRHGDIGIRWIQIEEPESPEKGRKKDIISAAMIREAAEIMSFFLPFSGDSGSSI